MNIYLECIDDKIVARLGVQNGDKVVQIGNDLPVTKIDDVSLLMLLFDSPVLMLHKHFKAPETATSNPEAIGLMNEIAFMGVDCGVMQ